MTKKENLLKGIISENPVFVLMLGMCPTLATTTSLESGLGMGLSVLFVLILSNTLISLIRKIVPDEIRIPMYITVIATCVTLLEFLLEAYFYSIYESLGIFLPLIVVNCIILGRAEAFASKNTIIDSIIDAIGMGLGFTISLGILAAFRELLGTGSIKLLGIQLMETTYAANILIKPAGGFLSLAALIIILRLYKQSKKGAA